MSARAIFHLFLHAAVPALLAWLFWRKRFASAWLLMLLGWIIDLDHLLADPIYAPFLKGLEYAHTTTFVDEAGQRQGAIDMVNRVLLENQDPKASLDQAAAAEQAIIDAAKM